VRQSYPVESCLDLETNTRAMGFAMLNSGLVEFPKINKVVLLGGGQVLCDLVDFIQVSKLDLTVLISPRHSQEKFDDGTLVDFLELRNVDFHILESINVNNLNEALGSLEETVCLSLGAAWVFSQKVISDVFSNRLLNSHGTRLPQNRGGGGFSWQVLTSNRFGFTTLHLVDAGIDTGPIISQEEFLYPASCRIPADYQDKFNNENLLFLKAFISRLMDSPAAFEMRRQSESMSSYWPRLSSDINSWIDWSLDPISLERFICAFDDPYPGAKTYIDGKLVHVKKVVLNFEDGQFHPFQSGLVYRTGRDWICVAASGAGLIIESLQNDSGNSVLGDVQIGDRFDTPSEILTQARNRVSYGPTGLRP
jgi:methionyl-tRNA formyltransferase